MNEDLFKKALNIDDPWQLKHIDFNPYGKRTDLYISSVTAGPQGNLVVPVP